MPLPHHPRVPSPLVLALLSSSLTAPAFADVCPAPGLAERAVAIEVATAVGPAHGTGVLWDELGRVVTNHHVVAAGANPVLIRADGRRVAARVIADARDSDLAVLEPMLSDRSGLPPPTIAVVFRGVDVVEIGNTGGRGLVRGSGVVVATNRAVDNGTARLSGMIESTVPLMPGDSGGPMFDCVGRLVGINAAAVITGGRSRVGYAIPAADAARLVADLAGTVPLRPIAPRLGALVRPSGVGLAVLGITPGTPAARAGLRVGDVILGIDDRPSRDPAELIAAVAAGADAGSVFVTIDRLGLPLGLTVDLVRG